MTTNQNETSNGRKTVDKKLVLSALLLLGLTASFQAAAGWTIKLEGTVAGAVSTPINLGEFVDAQDGYDGRYDGPAFPGSSRVNLHFERSAWGKIDTKFWYDMKSLSPLQQWDFDASSTLYNQNLTLTWDLAKLPADYILTLGDGVTGEVIDMRAQSSYTYTNTGSRRFMVTVKRVIPEAPVASGPGKGKGPDFSRLPAQAKVPATAGRGKGNAYGQNGKPQGKPNQ